MQNEKTTKHLIRKVLIALIVAGIVVGCIFSHFGGLGTGKCADTTEFAKYASKVSEISIPAHARIVALGEATHGNVEFQQLKLEVFKIMVEKYGVRAFALEGDYGGCEAVNRYIHNGNGTAQEAIATIGFPIYQTEQMEQLIAWMREYNATASEENQLCFYGFDMQRYKETYQYLLEVAKELGATVSDLEKLWDNEKDCYSEAYNAEQWEKVIDNVKCDFKQNNTPKAVQAIHFADILLQNHELGKSWGGNDMYAIRDSFMADNVRWILEQEQARGNQRIFVSAHNVHIKRHNNYRSMGSLLANQFGKDYFVIGTDFYKARVSLPKNLNDHYNRSNHTFYSHNPLAKASKKCGFEMSWLDFSKIPNDSLLNQYIQGSIKMGSVGEGYSPLMTVLPMTYRTFDSPAKLYDGMIFVAKAHPIAVKQLR